MSLMIEPLPTNFAVVEPSWFSEATIAKVTFTEPSYWFFGFSSGTSISVECLWRISDSQAIILTSEDHRQLFGLPAPVEAASHAMELLAQCTVTEFSLRPETLDLSIKFSGGQRLEILVTSAGYESWQIVSPKRKHIIAQGGGQLCIYTE